MIVTDFDTQNFEITSKIFLDEIENDPWIMYHGTSCVNEQAIEHEGFMWKPANISRHKLQRVVNVFEKMNWYGTDSTSRTVLEPFSLSHDFNGSESSPIYFAETSKRALLYATRDFAGGEKLRSLRKSFEQLRKYLDDSQVRQDHMHNLQYEYDDLERKGAYMAAYPKPEPVDLIWLSQELSALEDVSCSAMSAFDRHAYGIVYAIKVDQQDIEHLTYHNTMGIKVTCCIAPGKIQAKTIVPGDLILKAHGRSFEEVMKLENFTTGVYSSLKNKAR